MGRRTAPDGLNAAPRGAATGAVDAGAKASAPARSAAAEEAALRTHGPALLLVGLVVVGVVLVLGGGLLLFLSSGHPHHRGHRGFDADHAAFHRGAHVARPTVTVKGPAGNPPKRPAPHAASPRPAARDPFAGRPLPAPLAALRRRVDQGHDLGDAQIKTLRRYARAHPGDARPFILLARTYVGRGWLTAALQRYVEAFDSDPSSRGEPHMLGDLVSMLSSDAVGGQAARAIERIYGAEARPAVARALATGHPNRVTEARLRRLLGRLGP